MHHDHQLVFFEVAGAMGWEEEKACIPVVHKEVARSSTGLSESLALSHWRHGLGGRGACISVVDKETAHSSAGLSESLAIWARKKKCSIRAAF